jgi:opacity protein-like surface antigen
MEDSAFWGLGFAYHINNHFAVRGEFSSGYPDYAASFNGSRLSGEAFVTEGRFNLDYHILPGPLTPYVSGGLGYFYVDTGIPSGPPGYTIWWDYWWGYTVTVSQPTYRETFFTLNAAAGLRWDINDDFFLKAEAGWEWIEVDNGADWLQSLRGTVSIGWKF